MKCSFCNKKAIYEKNKKFCKEHFNNYFLKKVEKVAYIGKLFNKKILVCVSGGKDSSALAFSLKELSNNFNLELFHINLRIGRYSKICLDKVKELSNFLNLKLNLIDIRKYKLLNEIKTDEKICGVCGTIKRYLMNKFAFENGFDVVATGHNLDDISAFIFNALIHQNIGELLEDRIYKNMNKEFKLVAKVKPLCFLTEKETMLFSLTNEIPFTNEECPYSSGSTQIKFKEIVGKINEIVEIKAPLLKTFLKISKITQKEEEYNKCENCGFPSLKRICKFCKILNDSF